MPCTFARRLALIGVYIRIRIHAIGHCLEAVIIKPSRTTMEYAGTLARHIYGSVE
jgi:hypothetical protein